MHDQARRCVECGLGWIVWKGNGGEGYLLDGERYCCRDCAERRGCICIGRQVHAGETEETNGITYGYLDDEPEVFERSFRVRRFVKRPRFGRE